MGERTLTSNKSILHNDSDRKTQRSWSTLFSQAVSLASPPSIVMIKWLDMNKESGLVKAC